MHDSDGPELGPPLSLITHQSVLYLIRAIVTDAEATMPCMLIAEA